MILDEIIKQMHEIDDLSQDDRGITRKQMEIPWDPKRVKQCLEKRVIDPTL